MPKFLLGVTEHSGVGGVAMLEVPLPVGYCDTHRRVLVNPTESLFTLAQRRFGPFALGDVEVHPRPAHGLPALVEVETPAYCHPMNASVCPADARLEFKLAGLHSAGERRVENLSV